MLEIKECDRLLTEYFEMDTASLVRSYKCRFVEPFPTVWFDIKISMVDAILAAEKGRSEKDELKRLAYLHWLDMLHESPEQGMLLPEWMRNITKVELAECEIRRKEHNMCYCGEYASGAKVGSGGGLGDGEFHGDERCGQVRDSYFFARWLWAFGQWVCRVAVKLPRRRLPLYRYFAQHSHECQENGKFCQIPEENQPKKS